MIEIIVGRKGYGKTSYLVQRFYQTKTPKIAINPFHDTRLPLTFDYLPERINILKNTTLFIDEISLFQNCHHIPEFLNEFILILRYNNNAIIATSRRLSDFHQNLWSSVDRLVCFQIISHRDKQALLNFVDKKTVERISNLKQFEFLSIDC